MIRASVLYSVLAASAALVSAHGSVNHFGAGGEEWLGPIPGSGPDSNSPTRVLSSLEPINDPHSGAMTCGPGSQQAKVVAEVTAGQDVVFGWRSGMDTNWPHKLGPVMLYAYKCPGKASDCQPGGDDKGWALIDAAGYDLERNPDLWVHERFFNGERVPAKMPAGLPDGDYLLRHEIVALHKPQAPEFYVSCTQVHVTGGGSSNQSLADAGAELVSFPGGYRGNEAGLMANVFGGVNKDTYQFPGPKLFNPSKSSTPPAQTNNPEPETTSTDPTVEPTSTESGPEPTTLSDDGPTPTPTKQCKKSRKLRRELRKARKEKRAMGKRAVEGREAHKRHRAALAARRL